MKTNLILLRQAVYCLLLCFGLTSVQAQMRVGQPSGSPDPSVALDVSGGPYSSGSSYRGIAPPKVALTQTSSAAPVTNPAMGLLIYNTAKAGDVTPGYYYWEGFRWLRFTTSSTGAARVAAVNGQSIPAYLMSQVASLTTPPDIIYIADQGREGVFRFVSGASTPVADNALTLNATGGKYRRIITDGVVTPRMFGAVGDSITNDRQALLNALNSAYKTIVIDPGIYRIDAAIAVSGLSNKKIIATGARIINSDKGQASFLFSQCNNIEWVDGSGGYTQSITSDTWSNNHFLQFDKCQVVKVSGLRLNNLPGSGIVVTACTDFLVQKNTIQHSWRDGIFTRYNSVGKILNNTVIEANDDAISIHDNDKQSGGVESDKTDYLVAKYGVSQTTNIEVAGNTILNCVQGVTTIGADGVNIHDNTMINTVNTGIGIYNLNNTDPSYAKNSLIKNNRIFNACATTVINSLTIANNGQASTGRAAIFVGSLGLNNQINNGEAKYLENITVEGNIVFSSGANDFFGWRVTGLFLRNNTFYNANPLTGSAAGPVEISSCSNMALFGNTVIDTRTPKVHAWGYGLFNSYGSSDGWTVTGTQNPIPYAIAGGSITTQDLSINNVAIKRQNIDTNGSTDLNSLTVSGYHQVSGSAVSPSIHFPSTSEVANAGNLEVVASNDVVTQRYTDYTGRQTQRVLNGISSGSWSAWSGQPLNAANLPNLQLGPNKTIAFGSLSTGQSNAIFFNTPAGQNSIYLPYNAPFGWSSQQGVQIFDQGSSANPTLYVKGNSPGQPIAVFNTGGSTDKLRVNYDGVQIEAKIRTNDPTTSDIPAGYMMLWKKVGDLPKLWFNDGGIMRSITFN